MGVDARYLEVGCQQVVRPYHEVFLLVAFHGIARHLEVARHIARKLFAHELDFQRIGQRDRVEHGFEVVVTILSLTYYVQSKVYLGARKCNHILVYFKKVNNIFMYFVCKVTLFCPILQILSGKT